ncbi:MAG TPA: hypothetical protein VNV82_24005 [Bryobacteraceae bacterium]|jgi:hypothetical protein|nr:hypothetical protein [Bryobacteraceae bacterium]
MKRELRTEVFRRLNDPNWKPVIPAAVVESKRELSGWEKEVKNSSDPFARGLAAIAEKDLDLGATMEEQVRLVVSCYRQKAYEKSDCCPVCQKPK